LHDLGTRLGLSHLCHRHRPPQCCHFIRLCASGGPSLRDIESPESRGTRVVCWSRKAEKPGTVLLLVMFFTAAVSGSRTCRGWAFYPTSSASGLRLWAQTTVVNIGTDFNLLNSHSEQFLLSGGDKELERRSRDARETQSAPVYRTVLVISTLHLGALTRSAASFALGNRSVSVAPCLTLLVRALLVHDTRRVSLPPQKCPTLHLPRCGRGLVNSVGLSPQERRFVLSLYTFECNASALFACT
jgi:hypothetical protein